MASKTAADIPPNNTVYIKNLNEKLKTHALKVALEAAFSQFGTVVEIHAKKSAVLRGQAFVVFKEITSAINAVKSMQGFLFFDKKMVVQFARKESNTIAKQKGTFVMKQKTAKNKENVKKSVVNIPVKKNAPENSSDEDDSDNDMDDGDDDNDNDQEEQTNNILFIQNLPQDRSEYCTDFEAFLSKLPGFKELREVPGRTDIAFVEYENTELAKAAKDVMNGFKIGINNVMRVTYAKI